jgi:ATP-dependent DNA ligase
VRARFIEPMLLLRTERLSDSSDLLYEIKLDGYRAIAFKSGGRTFVVTKGGSKTSADLSALAQR